MKRAASKDSLLGSLRYFRISSCRLLEVFPCEALQAPCSFRRQGGEMSRVECKARDTSEDGANSPEMMHVHALVRVQF